MANEIEVSISISASKGGMSVARSENFKADMDGDAMTHSVQAIGTSETLLVESAAITNAGWVVIKNLDGSASVEIGREGADADEYPIELLAGQSCVFRASDQDTGSADLGIYAKASSADTNVEYVIIEQ